MKNSSPRLSLPPFRRWATTLALLLAFFGGTGFETQTTLAQSLEASADTPPSSAQQTAKQSLVWTEMPSIPNALGVAGPFVGVHEDRLLLAGGANFPEPIWEQGKQWHAAIYALEKTEGGYQWRDVGVLPKSVAYGANVSTPQGVLCIGGNDETQLFQHCFRLSWNKDSSELDYVRMPDLPHPLAYSCAALIGSKVYVTGGQSGVSLDTAINYFFTLDLSQENATWEKSEPWPFPPRAFHMSVAQNNGFRDCLYIMGGRYQDGDQVRILDDCWEFDPKLERWRQRASLPSPLTAGAGIRYGQSHVLVLSGDDGALFGQADVLKDEHPGFTKRTYSYNTITDRWIYMGKSPQNQVTTSAVYFDSKVVLPSGEIRPRVRTPQVWQIQPEDQQGEFGLWDYLVLTIYLAALVLIGVYFSRQTANTNDYFRASGKIPWWAAGCSIFATMLSSLTFTGVPSKAFAQDWVYSVGNFLIPVVAIFAVLFALPFFRQIDATSAYEYLEKRFHWSVRTFGSLCFSVFHLFRMAIVMSLTGFAIAVATPLTPVQSVLLMGVLSIVYCTLGGISAVIWTDTLQTFVLLGGALLAIVWMLYGTGSTIAECFSEAVDQDKLRMANWHWSPFDAQIAFWVIVLGAIGQNTSSYIADQAVVQRYMTTKTEGLAARAIWTNALLSIPATLLFFGIGTALFLFYRAHPERIDISTTTDQIFPLFISRELPTGVAGLIVAAIFAAAQSTVSTSMNSVATTLLTDCFRSQTERLSETGALRLAQALTVVLGVVGTLIALLFLDPDIISRFDEFLKVIGLFMGVLGGLFVLGAVFRRANSFGAWMGAISGNLVLFWVWKSTQINGYLYAFIGIATCVTVGYFGSLLTVPKQNIEHLCLGFKRT